MKREDLRKGIKAVTAQISKVENAEEVEYKTSTKFIPNLGYVADLPTLRDCAKALTRINKHFEAETESATELGIEADEIAADTNYLGHRQKVWLSDIQKRVDELKRETELEKLYKAKETLMKHRSKEDIFAEDMEDIAGILGKLDIED